MGRLRTKEDVLDIRDGERLYLVCKDWKVVNISNTAERACKWANELEAEVILQIHIESMFTRKEHQWNLN